MSSDWSLTVYLTPGLQPQVYLHTQLQPCLVTDHSQAGSAEAFPAPLPGSTGRDRLRPLPTALGLRVGTCRAGPPHLRVLWQRPVWETGQERVRGRRGSQHEGDSNTAQGPGRFDAVTLCTTRPTTGSGRSGCGQGLGPLRCAAEDRASGWSWPDWDENAGLQAQAPLHPVLTHPHPRPGYQAHFRAI